MRSVHFGAHTSFLAIKVWLEGAYTQPRVQYDCHNSSLSSVHTCP